jgi:pyridoxamine 5'-phosphate oxidase
MRPAQEFLPEPLPAEPLEVVARWLAEAVAAGFGPNPNAMVLATADARGYPHARVVLCKDLRVRPGYVTFFTNYESHKARDLSANPRAAAVMHWDRLGRQVRLEGRVVQTTAGESDAYFASRPWQSRVGAWASRQSEPVGSRAELERALQLVAQRFGVRSPLAVEATEPDPGVVIGRPPHWGGYHLWIEAVELWVSGDARLHDRARWQRTLTPAPPAGGARTAGTARAGSAPSGTFDPGPWQATRLQP